MTDILIGALIAAGIVAAAIGWLTVAGGARAERARRIEQARCRHPAGRTPRQLTPLGDGTWAPVCRSCGAQGDPITTNTTIDAFAWLDAWDHTCEPHAGDLNEWRHRD